MVTLEPAEILVVGHLGMLGHTLLRRLGGRARGVDRAECDVTDPARIAEVLEQVRPRTIVNCAAYTAVDQAESEPELARRLNADAVENLSRAAAARNIHFITISTDYVFNGAGDAPFDEDAPESAFGPTSVYGQTKLEGEQRLVRAGGDWCIARTQWLYGEGGKNFIDRIAQLAAERPALKVVDDQIGAPTWVEDLAGALEVLIDRRATGYYHLVNSGFDSWCAVARHVVARLGLPCEVAACASEEYPTPAKRPKNSRLSQRKYAALAGAPLRPWREAVDEYLAAKKK
jgi:dTDP-4-dehydrorhamnose reductase